MKGKSEKEEKHIQHKLAYAIGVSLFISLFNSMITFVIFDTGVSFFFISFIFQFIILTVLFFLFLRLSAIKKVPLKVVEKHHPLLEMKYTLMDMNVKWVYYAQIGFTAALLAGSLICVFLKEYYFASFFFVFCVLIGSIFYAEDRFVKGLVLFSDKGLVLGNSVARYYFINWHNIEDYQISDDYCYIHLYGLGRLRFPVLDKEKQIRKIMKSYVK